jgi:hypothetical protein
MVPRIKLCLFESESGQATNPVVPFANNFGLQILWNRQFQSGGNSFALYYFVKSMLVYLETCTLDILDFE